MKAYKIKKNSNYYLELTNLENTVPKNNQVKVKIYSCSLNYRDLMVLAGQYGSMDVTNITPLSDGAGEVVEVGENVQTLKVGDKVCGLFMKSWILGDIKQEDALSARGGAVDGMLCEFVVDDENTFIKFPSYLNYEQASTLPCAALTAYNAIFRLKKIKKGDFILIQGTGGVSTFALQFANAFGLKTICLTSSKEKENHLKNLNSDYIINYLENPDWHKEIYQITNQKGADLVVEVGGAKTLDRSLKSVKVGGEVSCIGVLSGVNASISTIDIIRRSVILRGIFVGSKEIFLEMNNFLDQYKIEPIISKIFKFEDTKNAYEFLRSKKHIGKVVINL